MNNYIKTFGLICIIIFAYFTVDKLFLNNTKEKIVEVKANIINEDKNSKYLINDFYNGKLLSCSEEEISLTNITGDKLYWNEKISLLNILYKRQNQYVLLASKFGYQVYIFNESGKKTEYNTQYKIIDANINSNGFACIIQDDNERNIVTVFDSVGKRKLERITFQEKSGRPICSSISEDNRNLVISYLRVEGTKIKSYLEFFDLNSEELIDNLYATKAFEGELIYKTEYTSSGDITVISDKNVMGINITKDLHNKINIEEKLDKVFLNEDKNKVVALLDGKKGLEIYDVKGLKKYNATLNTTAELFKYQNGLILAGDKNSIYCYNLNAQHLWTVNMAQAFNDIILINTREILTIGGGQSTLYTVK